ncbi:hypothetical protein BGZ75_006126 [Mortierella antarctica]|nr:hypothetical protein BGZ75_006126 [Mortierella antarctica]
MVAVFENAEYQAIIDKINKIRSYGLSKMITIPQIAILGDQSSGKSSVLEAITQLSFPRNIDTCTRFATQVSMRQSEREELSAHIDGEPAFNKHHQHQDATLDICSIIHEANRILCSSTEISEKVLEITISGPTMSPLTIIDLPGYINTTMDGQDKRIIQTIRDINTRYIKDSRTIILAVVPANIDLNNMFVLGEAERYDPANERTIPIVTKPDTIEQDLLPNLIQTLQNKRKFMKLGYLVMKNSSFKELDNSWEEARMLEATFFKSSQLWNQVPEERKGRIGVKNFLGNLLYEHIKKELPNVKKDIFRLIGDLEREFTDLGPEVSTPENAKAKYFEWILRIKRTLEEVLDGKYSLDYIKKSTFAGQDERIASNHYNHVDGNIEDPVTLECDRQYIRASLHKLYDQYNAAMNKDDYMLSTDKINDLVQRYRANELIGFNSFKTFTQIYAGTLDRWHELTKSHIANIHRYLHDAIASFLSFTADPLLKDTLLLEFDKFYSVQTSKINETIESVFADESIPFTMNMSYYYQNVVKIRNTMAKDNMERLLALFRETGIQDTTEAAVDAKHYEQLAVEDLEDQLKAYCDVARLRIIDTILMQTIERSLVKQIGRYFDMLILVDDNTISSRLVDSPTKRRHREELNEKVAVLRKSLQEL